MLMRRLYLVVALLSSLLTFTSEVLAQTGNDGNALQRECNLVIQIMESAATLRQEAKSLRAGAWVTFESALFDAAESASRLRASLRGWNNGLPWPLVPARRRSAWPVPVDRPMCPRPTHSLPCLGWTGLTA